MNDEFRPDQTFTVASFLTNPEQVPKWPGCYAFVDDSDNRVLRVGRSNQLRFRIQSYVDNLFNDRMADSMFGYMKMRGSPFRVFLWFVVYPGLFERSLIVTYNPPFNLQIPKIDKVMMEIGVAI